MSDRDSARSLGPRLSMNCSYCGRVFEVAVYVSGQTVRCQCGATVNVPWDDSYTQFRPTIAEPELPTPEPRRGPIHSRRPRSYSKAQIFGPIAAGLSILAFLFVLLWLFQPGYHSNSTDPMTLAKQKGYEDGYLDGSSDNILIRGYGGQRDAEYLRQRAIKGDCADSAAQFDAFLAVYSKGYDDGWNGSRKDK